MANKSINYKIFDRDPILEHFKSDVLLRINDYKEKKKDLLKGAKKLSQIANMHEYYGFHKIKDAWIYREWAPAADAVYLTGEFNDWNPTSHSLTRIDENTWEIKIKGIKSLSNNSRVKVIIEKNNERYYHIPLFINKVEQEIKEDGSLDFYGIIDNSRKYNWKHDDFKIKKDFKPLIYETHIGIAQEKESIGSFKEFTKNILPRIKDNGYNAIQIMALASHVYYGSFGYHVTNFFSTAHWFGDRKDLKELIDTAHKMGIAVFMDIVHSHAAKNVHEGINLFDTTNEMFFYEGDRGNHQLWDSKLFNYGKNDVIKFLLSNLKYFIDEYHIDGFRFDGVTSMIYQNHGIGTAFVSYDNYFSMNTNIEALTYLTLANDLIKEIKKSSVTIAEDVSGMPGLCLPINEGGVGFDYRFSMGVPDFWVRTLKRNDHNWDLNWMWYELTTKRNQEKTITYTESHDQALVGDKTLMFRLTDAEIYWHMHKDDKNIVIDRAIALHKLIRFATISTGADGYLNFMGNEFGHPEWIDFPSERNGWSYKYAKRQWHLVDDKDLKYRYLNNFDKEMIAFSKAKNLLDGQTPQLIMIHNDMKLLMFRKNDLYFLFNFHPTNSYEGLSVPIVEGEEFKVVFDTDTGEFGGFDRISKSYVYHSKTLYGTDYEKGIQIYLPSRTALVLKKIK